ncbi:hypothetical protein ACMV8I_18880 [Ewingella sp. S1.OA.A_B6]
MVNLSNNPLLQQAYDVIQAIEKCGASIELTAAVTKASALLTAIDEFIKIREAQGVPVSCPDFWLSRPDAEQAAKQRGKGHVQVEISLSFTQRFNDDVPVFTTPQLPMAHIGYLYAAKDTGAVIYSIADSDIEGAQLVGPIYGNLVLSATLNPA